MIERNLSCTGKVDPVFQSLTDKKLGELAGNACPHSLYLDPFIYRTRRRLADGHEERPQHVVEVAVKMVARKHDNCVGAGPLDQYAGLLQSDLDRAI